MPQRLSKEEFLALQNLRKNKNNAIQKSDKDNSVVIVYKVNYLDKMKNLLNYTQRFEKSNLKNDGILNFFVSQKNMLIIFFKKISSPSLHF